MSLLWWSYYVGVCGACIAAAHLRNDWTWLLTAALTVAAWIVHLVRLMPMPPGNGLTRFCPVWMRTSWGQWLARRVPFFARRWQSNMQQALIFEADVEAAVYTVKLLAAMNAWVHTQRGEDELEQVMAMWCAWRNHAERAHRYREERAGKSLDLPVQLQGHPRAEEFFKDVLN